MFPDISNWNGIFLAILAAFLFLLGCIEASDGEDIPRDDTTYISKESWAEARRQIRRKGW